MTRSSLLRENDAIVYLIKERWLVSVTSFDQWKNVTCTLTLLNSGGSWIFFINISFENGLRKFKLLNYSEKM